MSKLYNFTFRFIADATYTAETEDEAREKLEKEHGDVCAVTLCDKEEFDPNEDDYKG